MNDSTKTTQGPVIRLVDDDDVLRHSLKFLLQAEGWGVRDYPSAKKFLTEDILSTPGCLVLDIRMPEMSGLELQNELLHRGVTLPIVFLTGHGTMETAVDAMKKGAVDFVAKPIDPEQFVSAIREAMKRAAVKGLGYESAGGVVQAWSALTSREQEVCEWLAKGLLNREVARKLEISERTVEGHRASAFKKLGIHSVSELVLLSSELKEHGVPDFTEAP